MGQLQDAGNTTTLSHYLNLLDTAGLLGGLEKYSNDIIRKRSSSPKFQVHNSALISAQSNEMYKEIFSEFVKWGRIVESSVGAHLINLSIGGMFAVYYWRQGNSEIDFVLEKNGKVIGLEVKSGASQAQSGMNDFKNTMHPDKVILIGNSGIHWQEFLKINPVELF